MPQMFPMPFAFLMFATMILLLLSMVRIYWQNVSTSSSEVENSKVDLYFKQVW